MSGKRLTILMSLFEGMPLSRVSAWEFHGMGRFSGGVVGVNESGVYLVGDSCSANGEQMDSVVEFFATDFDSLRTKVVKCVYVTGYFGGDMRIKVRADDSPWHYFPFNVGRGYAGYGNNPGMEHRLQTIRVPVARGIKGTVFQFGIENVGGSDFGITSVDVLMVYKKR